MKIYKYLSAENAIKTLRNNSVLLNNPIEYNDPFDCVISPTKEDEEECFKRIANYYLFKEFSKIILNKKIKIPFGLLWVRWELKLINKLMKKHPYYDKMPGFDGMMKMAFKKYSEKEKNFLGELEKNKALFLKKIKSAVNEIKEMLLVSCFSTSYDSILLWSHYGDKHKGVCIEFEVEGNDFKKVEYDKNRKQLDLKTITAIVLGYDYIGEEINKDNPLIIKTISKVLLTKSREWQYESEYRTLRSTKDIDNDAVWTKDNMCFLKMPKIKRIYTGCRINKDDLESIKNEFKEIEILQLIDSDREYKLLINGASNKD